MDDFGSNFLLAPAAVQAIMLAVFSGVLGFVGLMIFKVSARNKIFFPVIAGAIGAGLLLGFAVISAQKPSIVPTLIRRALLEQKFFQAVEKHHPVVFDKLITDTSTKLTSGDKLDLSEDKVKAAAMSAMSKSLPALLDETVVVASNASLMKLMNVEQDTLDILREKDPEGCSDFALGKTGTWMESLDEVERQALMDVRAEVIESAAVSPTEHKRMSAESIGRILAGPNGLTLSQLQTFANANVASPRELCSVTIAVYKVLRNQGPVKGPDIYVAVTKLGATE